MNRKTIRLDIEAVYDELGEIKCWLIFDYYRTSYRAVRDFDKDSKSFVVGSTLYKVTTDYDDYEDNLIRRLIEAYDWRKKNGNINRYRLD